MKLKVIDVERNKEVDLKQLDVFKVHFTRPFYLLFFMSVILIPSDSHSGGVTSEAIAGKLFIG